MSKTVNVDLYLTDKFKEAVRPTVTGYYELINEILQKCSFDPEKAKAASNKLFDDIGELLTEKEATEDDYYQLASLKLLMIMALNAVVDIDWDRLRLEVMDPSKTKVTARVSSTGRKTK